MKRLLLNVVFMTVILVAGAQSVNGVIYADTMGVEVVKVWGTHAERGYALGYLTGSRITDLIKNYIKPSFGPYYSVARGIITAGADIQIPTEYLTESQAVVEGMNAAGSNTEAFDQTDIVLANSFLDVSNLLAKKGPGNGCSTLMSWGDATAGTDLNGKAVVSRHMDWTVNQVLYRNNSIIVHFPSEPTETKWLLIGYSGMLSALSGANTSFSVFQQMMSDANISGQHNKLYEPIWMTLRKALESPDYNNDGAANVQDIKSALNERTTGFADAYIITSMGINNPVDSLVAMVAEIAPIAPTHTYRYNDFPDSIPGDNLYAANNQIRRNNAMNFCNRYNGIRNNIGDGTMISTERNWELMRDYSHQSNNMQFMLYAPETDLLRLSVYSSGKPAYQNDPVNFSLAELFEMPFTGFEETSSDNIQLYPVPAADKIIVNCITAGKYEAAIIDFNGRTVFSEKVNLPGSLSLPALHTGLYTLRLNSGKLLYTRKLCINN